MNYYLEDKKLIIKIDSLFVKTIQEFLDALIAGGILKQDV